MKNVQVSFLSRLPRLPQTEQPRLPASARPQPGLHDPDDLSGLLRLDRRWQPRRHRPRDEMHLRQRFDNVVSVIYYYNFFVLCFAGVVDLSSTDKDNFLPILLYSSWECWHNNEKICMASCFKKSTGSKTWTQDYLVTSSLCWQCWPLEHHQLSIMKQ